MAKVRFIGMSPKDGSLNTETIVFTTDFEAPASNWLTIGNSVYCDKVIEMEVPSMFPMDTEFSRS